MLWEIAEDIKRYFKTTFIPSMKNLFSSARGLVGLFFVMLVIQTLLCVICVTGIENIGAQQTVLEEFKLSVASESSIIAEASGSFITSDEFKTALSSTSIFIGALILWGVCALTVYKKITFASADRDKYIWGMLITHGAKKKKIKAMLRCELYLPQLVATAVAYPLSLWLCNYSLRDLGYAYSHSVWKLLAVLVLSYVCIRLVVEYQCFLIRSMSCTEMLREEDAPKSICYPRKSARLVKGFTPFRYGTSAFFRMRKYYVSLALLAAVPALIWICLNVSATGEDSYLAARINEFAVTLSSGISEKELSEISEEQLGGIDGVSSVEASAYYESSKIYTHLLADKGKFSTVVDSPYYTDIYADNTITLVRNDRAFKQLTGFNIPSVKDGTAVIVAPSDGAKYNFSEGDRLFLAISKSDGSVRAVTEDTLTMLESDLEGTYEYAELEIADVHYTKSSNLSASGFLNVTDTYIVLNTEEYERITSLSVDTYISYVKTADLSAETSLDSTASFDVTLPLSAFSNLPSEGDCIEIDGSYTLTFSLTGLPSYDGDIPDVYENHMTTGEFDYAYVNSVSVSGDSVTLNVTPHDIIVIERGVGIQPTVVLAIGTPKLESKVNSYFANTYENVTLAGGSVTLTGETAIVHTSTAVTAAEVGTHAILSKTSLVSTDGKLFLEELYADNSFDIACGDKTTLTSMGLNTDTVTGSDAVLVLPSDGIHHFAFSVGDKIRLATTLENVALYNSDSTTEGGSYDTLTEHLKLNSYDYTAVYVTAVIYSDNVDAPVIIVSKDSFCSVINKKNPYINLEIYLDPNIDGEQYTAIRSAVNDWATSRPLKPSVSSTGEYLDHLLRKNANYSTIIMLISLIVPLIIPFIWYYPLATLFDRRRTELYVLHSMGKKKRTVRACFLFEGAAVTLTAFASVFLLCYPAMFIFKTVCSYFKLPLEFEYSYLSLSVLLVAAAASAVCAAVAFALCFATTKHKKKTRKPRRKYGNT